MADDRLQRAVDFGRNRERQLGHRLHRLILADRDLQLLRDVRNGKNLRDGQERVHVLLVERAWLPRDDVERADGPALCQEGKKQGRFEPGRVQHVDVQKICGVNPSVVDDQRLARSDDGAERGPVGFEDHVGPWPGAALDLIHPRRICLEFLPVVGQQGKPHAIAGNQADDALRERLKRERNVDGP